MNTAKKRIQKANSNKNSFLLDLKQNWQYLVFLLLPITYLIIFEYGPLVGVQIAFRDYRPKLGIWGSPWVGFENFTRFLKSYNFWTILKNTLAVSLYGIFAGFPIPIILALMLHSCKSRQLRKLTQNVSYIPHFISVVVLVGIVDQILNPITGLVGAIYRLSGGVGYLQDLRGDPNAFRGLFVWSGVWQNMGWNTIIYISALCGVSPELHEAAMIDGATRFQRLIHVDIPAILPTIAIMLILRCGQVMSVGYEKVYLMQNALNLSTSEVISTYVYKVGLGQDDFSFAAAIDLFNSVINCIMLITVNSIARKASDGEMGLY